MVYAELLLVEKVMNWVEHSIHRKYVAEVMATGTTTSTNFRDDIRKHLNQYVLLGLRPVICCRHEGCVQLQE